MMTAIELDPLFMKALKLLQSKAKDSSAQLKYMLDDAIAQRKGLKVPAQSGDHSDKPPLPKGKNEDDVKRKDGEKRPLEKTSKDPFEPEVKRSKFEQTKQKDKESKDKEKEREKLRREKEKKEKEEAQRQKDKAEKEKKEKESPTKQDSDILSDEEETAQQMDAGDFARDLGIACVVCRQFDVSSGNQLVECQECHSLYHQECHKPPVTGQDVSDPRFVWYCSRCTKSLKKMMAQKPIKSTKPVLPLSTSTKEASSTIASKTNKSETDSGSQAFRRIDPKAIVTPKDTGNLTSSSKAMVGLAGLAANLTKPRGESKNSSMSKKTEHKSDGTKSSSKSDVKTTGSKQESSSKQSLPSAKSDVKKSDTSKSSAKEDQREHKKSDSKIKTEDKKSPESTSRKEEKKEKTDTSAKSSKDEKKSDLVKPSPSQSAASNSSPPATPSSPVPATDAASSKSSGGSSSSSSSSSSNKQAVANLSMVTANKRIQMMKKKAQAQTKPQEKKVHIK